MPSWLNAFAVLKLAVSRQFGLRVMRIKEGQLCHVPGPMVRLVRLGGSVKEVRDEQPLHALPPLIVRLVRLGGSVKEVRDEQLCHVLPAIVRLVRLGGRVNEVKEEQPFHVFAPLIVRLVC